MKIASDTIRPIFRLRLEYCVALNFDCNASCFASRESLSLEPGPMVMIP